MRDAGYVRALPGGDVLLFFSYALAVIGHCFVRHEALVRLRAAVLLRR